MPGKNLHNKEFDEGTLTKLEIFEEYIKTWLPTFIMSGKKDIYIFDLFAGPGYDLSGAPGTPIRILEQIVAQIGHIFEKRTKVHVVFNEFDKVKYDSLKMNCEYYMQAHAELDRASVEISIYNNDLADLFESLLPPMQSYPSLVFLDQNGVKFLSQKYIGELEKMRETDFLYFVSSSYFIRFGNTSEFKEILNIDVEKAKRNPYKFIHRSILKQLQDNFPPNTTLKLYPFTIKKGPNIYGIIFGSHHPRGADKFLKMAWNMNSVNGEANFDIDDEEHRCALTLFGQAPTKVQAFQAKLEKMLLSGKINNNKTAFLFTLWHGHIHTHADQLLRRLKKEGKIIYNANTPLVNYEQIYQKNRIISYKLSDEVNKN